MHFTFQLQLAFFTAASGSPVYKTTILPTWGGPSCLPLFKPTILILYQFNHHVLFAVNDYFQ